MPKKVQMAPRLSPGTDKWYEKNFRTRNAGGEYVLSAWPGLYDRTLFELKGRFTREELLLIVDVFNSTALTPMLSGNEIDIQVRDGIDLDGLDEKWGIDRDALLAKIIALPIFPGPSQPYGLTGIGTAARTSRNSLTWTSM